LNNSLGEFEKHFSILDDAANSLSQVINKKMDQNYVFFS